MRTIVFDVNETLLDLRSMGPRFEEAFGSSELLGAWFSRLLRHSLVATVTDTYQPFDILAVDALELVAAKAGHRVTRTTASSVVDGMRHLPPHPDVRPGIELLIEHGFRVATLTNSPPRVLTDQLHNAGIDDLFSDALSVDPVRRFKPHPATYLSCADRLGIPIGRMRLVAAHDWDVTGAIRSGAVAASVARPGMLISGASETPDIVGSDLMAVVQAIVEVDRG
ncbi:MAG: haloacid dehalogenase type II [Acidimicrobiia bacterium]|nr:haloacid dehalogenase type II [Acidimicrobiia bacterium]